MTNLAFMFSNWYSGATLFAILLNNHSQLVCNGETFPFEYDITNKEVYVCSCGRHILDCQFYTTVADSLKNSDGSWNESFRILPKPARTYLGNRIVCGFTRSIWLRNLLLMPGMPLRTKLNEYLTRHQQFYDKARQYSKASCYIDGTKSIRRAELFQLYSKETIKVIYLIRDPRGFCWSFLKNKKLPKGQLPDAIRSWREYIDNVDIFTARYPTVEILTVRYEDLCANLAEILRAICGFLNVDYEQPLQGRPAEHHLLGNRMRSNFDGVIREDLSWKEKLTVAECKQISESLAEAMDRFHYI